MVWWLTSCAAIEGPELGMLLGIRFLRQTASSSGCSSIFQLIHFPAHPVIKFSSYIFHQSPLLFVLFPYQLPDIRGIKRWSSPFISYRKWLCLRLPYNSDCKFISFTCYEEAVKGIRKQPDNQEHKILRKLMNERWAEATKHGAGAGVWAQAGFTDAQMFLFQKIKSINAQV